MQLAGIDPAADFAQIESHKRRQLLGRECRNRFLAAFAKRRKASVVRPNDRDAVRFDRDFLASHVWFVIFINLNFFCWHFSFLLESAYFSWAKAARFLVTRFLEQTQFGPDHC